MMWLMIAAAAVQAEPAGRPMDWLNMAVYPRAAVENNEQGNVRVELAISPDGRVRSCTVIESSGSATLDDYTCVHFTRVARFKPRADGKAGDMFYKASMKWSLD